MARSVLILFVLSLLFFGIAHLVPGGICGLYPQKTIGACRSSLGLDDWLPVQYARWIGTYLHGNFGASPDGSSITHEILGGIPASVLLILGGTSVYLLVRPAFAFAIRRRNWKDRLESPLAVLAAAIPVFWLGLLLIYGFAVHWPILPLGGVDSPNIPPFWSDSWFAMIPGSATMMLVNLLKHLLLPSILLALVIFVADRAATAIAPIERQRNGVRVTYPRFIGNLPL